MNDSIFQDPVWYNATTLSERLASLRLLPSEENSDKVDIDLATHRLNQWRSQRPFTTGSFFAQRLALDQINERELHRILGEPIEAVRDRLPVSPQWLTTLAKAFSCQAAGDDSRVRRPNENQGGFLNIAEPLINQACTTLLDAIHPLIARRANLPIDPDTIGAILHEQLPGQLIMLLSRTLSLELNVARVQGQLEGNTPEERFQSFSTYLLEPDKALSILAEYPVLARQLVSCIDNWVNFSLEFLEHLSGDWETIRRAFSPEQDPGAITRILRVGDSHRGGRAVLIVTFSSGLKLVYKPKSLAVDFHFQQLLSWLNEHGDQCKFRTVRILPRETYGWCEYVTASSCDEVDEVWRFYERQGGYLALLYVLDATDFHYENLIAAGEHPVLVDLESLFHARPERSDQNQSSWVADIMGYSVLRVGLLPQRIWFSEDNEGIDVSGLGGAVAGQMTPGTVPYWVGTGTDEMRLTRRRVEMVGAENRPKLKDSEVDALAYREAITKGFTNIYKLLMQYRAEILADGGPIARFAGDTVRLIARPTKAYGRMMQESFHPDLLRNALVRDWFFDRLWVGVEHRAYLEKVVSSECRDLHLGDIPMFTTCPDTCDIRDSSGVIILDFLDEPGMNAVQGNLRQLNDDDLSQQLWFINAALATLVNKSDGPETSYLMSQPQVLASREHLIEAAKAVGERLETLALRREGGVSWLGLRFLNERDWIPLPLGLDLYDGLLGVTFFLAYLGHITGEKRFTSLAQATLRTIQDHLANSKDTFQSIGAFDGIGGWIYVLAHLGTLWSQPQLLADAEKSVELVPPLIQKDEIFDIIGGAAGCIGSLIALHKSSPSARTLAVATECGDRILAGAQPMPEGVSWPAPSGATRPPLSFSHGNAGVAWALLELAEVTGEKRFKKAFQGAIAYERSRAAPANGSGEQSKLAWCHGAPGIGLARLRALRYFDDPMLHEEVDAALQTTVSSGFGFNHSLCHGDLGNIELLLQASQTLDKSRWRHEVDRFASIILNSIKEYGWLSGVPLAIETPGLMTGLAGIGYELLRMAEPALVPSVLVLEPPMSHEY